MYSNLIWSLKEYLGYKLQFGRNANCDINDYNLAVVVKHNEAGSSSWSLTWFPLCFSENVQRWSVWCPSSSGEPHPSGEELHKAQTE